MPEASAVAEDSEIVDLLKLVAQDSNEKAFESSFAKRAKSVENEVTRAKKMTPFETYIALLKGYCSISIILFPKAVLHGGWLASALFELGSAVITTMCAIKLVQVGMKLKIYSYQLIVEHAFGPIARVMLEAMIAIT